MEHEDPETEVFLLSGDCRDMPAWASLCAGHAGIRHHTAHSQIYPTEFSQLGEILMHTLGPVKSCGCDAGACGKHEDVNGTPRAEWPVPTCDLDITC